MTVRLQAQRNGAPARACCTRAASNASILETVWRNDLRKSCLAIATCGVCRKQFTIGHRKSRRESTEPKVGCGNAENCRASVSDASPSPWRFTETPYKICEQEDRKSRVGKECRSRW